MEFACSVFADVDLFREKAGDLCGCAPTLLALTDDEILAALEAASDLLAQASGGMYSGQCQFTLRPRRKNDGWCDQPPIPLRPPAYDVVVKIDGVSLTQGTEFVVTRAGELIRLDPATHAVRDWPSCQTRYAPSTEANTFEVGFTTGPAPTIIEQTAAIELACQILNGWSGNSSDVLLGASSASGGGLTVEAGDEAGVSRSTAEKFLARWNPRQWTMRPSYYSPNVDYWDLGVVEWGGDAGGDVFTSDGEDILVPD